MICVALGEPWIDAVAPLRLIWFAVRGKWRELYREAAERAVRRKIGEPPPPSTPVVPAPSAAPRVEPPPPPAIVEVDEVQDTPPPAKTPKEQIAEYRREAKELQRAIRRAALWPDEPESNEESIEDVRRFKDSGGKHRQN